MIELKTLNCMNIVRLKLWRNDFRPWIHVTFSLILGLHFDFSFVESRFDYILPSHQFLNCWVIQPFALSTMHTYCIITRSFKCFTGNLARKVLRFIAFFFQGPATYSHIHLLVNLLCHLWQVKCWFNLLSLSSWMTRPVSCYREKLATFDVKEKLEVSLLTTGVLFIWQGVMGLILILNMRP